MRHAGRAGPKTPLSSGCPVLRREIMHLWWCLEGDVSVTACMHCGATHLRAGGTPHRLLVPGLISSVSLSPLTRTAPGAVTGGASRAEMRSRLASVVHTHCTSRGSDTVWAWFSNRVRSSAPKLGPRRGTCHCRWSRVGASSWGSENGPGWVGLTASQVQALATCAVRPAAPPHVSHPQFPPNHRATPSQAHLLPHIPVPLCTADFGEEPPDWRQGRAPHGGAVGLLHADTPQCPSGDEQGVARPARALWCEHNRQHCGAVTEASMVCTPLVCGAHACVPHHAHALLRALRVRAPACSNLGGEGASLPGRPRS